MTAYSYQDWNSLSQDEQSRRPGVSIPRSHPLNNPNRGVYWSGQSSALALATYLQDSLTSSDREEAETMFRRLKLSHRTAAEAPKAIDAAMGVRQLDAHRALGSSNFSLTDEQAEQMQSAIDDIYRLQTEAEIAGLDPKKVAEAMINRASATAVGFAAPEHAPPAMRAYLESREGRESQANLNQSVRQLYSLVREGEIDALDRVENISSVFPENATQADELDFVRSLMGSIPLERNPIPIEPRQDFSVRMDTTEEAKAMEMVLKWVGQQEQLPAPEVVHEAFNAWRDNGVVASPYEQVRDPRIGLIVGAGHTASELAVATIESLPGTRIIVMTSESDRFVDKGEIGGRPLVAANVVAGPEGVAIEGVDKTPDNAIMVINLSQEHATDSIKRSVAANAFVGTSHAIAHIAGTNLQPYEAQAIHLAGSMRKLSFGVNSMGDNLTNAQLRDLRTKSQEVDAKADPDRYYTAGHGRPVKGVSAVAFEGARNYDAAIRKFGKGRDPMGDAYGRISKHAAILTSDNPNMAAYKFLEANRGERPVLYAEAERKLSFARDIEAGLEGEKVMSREATTELTIYDRPRSARTGSPSEIVDWNDPRVRGAIVLVSGNAFQDAINSGAQQTKIAQEAIVDYAHTGVIFDDMQKDFHAAHMTRLALEMGKRFTVVNKEGDTVGLGEARTATRRNAQSFTEITDIQIRERFRGSLSGLDVSPEEVGRAPNGRRNVAYDLGHPVAQMTLAGLPGMNAEKAAGFSKMGISLEELFMSKDNELKEELYKKGMPSETIKALGDRSAWSKAVERALLNEHAAEKLDSRYAAPGESKLLPPERAGFINGPGTSKPVAALIGNALPTYDGATGDVTSPADLVDRKQLRSTIETLAKNGYAIATTFEEGIGKTVMEEAAKVPQAEVLVISPSNPMAAAPEMRMSLMQLIEQEQASVVMPTAIAGTNFEDAEGFKGVRYAELRTSMHDTIAHVADIAIVVQASDDDQCLHMVDKLNAKGKPIAVMIPDDVSVASTEAYRGNLKLARGSGRTEIESLGMAQAPSAQGYANIIDEDTQMSLVDGVMRGNAGTFQSARLARSDMARGGHHYKTIGWGAAAPVIVSQASVENIVGRHKDGGLEPMGPYVGKTARELEKASVARYEASEATRDMFKEQQQRHMAAVMDDAARSVGY